MKALCVVIAAALLLETAPSCASHPAASETRHRAIAFLLDATDRLGVDAVQLKAFAHTALVGARRGDSLSVFMLDGQSLQPREVWSAASPGRGSEAHALSEGSAYMERRFEQEIIEPLDSLIEVAAASRDTSATSSLIEGLWMVANHTRFGQANGPRELFWVSDFIENSPATLSLYHSPQASFFTADGKLRFPELRANLRDVSVVGLMLLRRETVGIQGPHLVNEWTKLVAAYGGRLELQMEPVR